MNPHVDVPRYDDPVDLPQDADLVNPAAATINNAPANNLNRTAFLAEGGYAAALNWSNGGASTHNLKRASFSELDQAWFAVGDGGNNFLEVSYDGGRSWVDLAASLATPKVLVDVAVGLPDVVVMTSTRDVYKGQRGGYASFTWPLQVNALSAAPTAGNVDYEPTSALYVALYRVGATGMRLDTSPDGVTWTARALPAAWSGYTGSDNPHLGAAPGRVVGVFPSVITSQTISVVYSTDGITYTAAPDLTSSIAVADFTAPIISRPVYDPRGFWWFTVSSSTADTSEVWKSTDGVNFTQVATFADADVRIRSASMLGPWWAMCLDNGGIVVSKDLGATWRWVASNAGTAANFNMRGGGGGALVVNSADKASFRSGRGGRAVGRVL